MPNRQCFKVVYKQLLVYASTDRQLQLFTNVNRFRWVGVLANKTLYFTCLVVCCVDWTVYSSTYDKRSAWMKSEAQDNFIVVRCFAALVFNFNQTLRRVWRPQPDCLIRATAEDLLASVEQTKSGKNYLFFVTNIVFDHFTTKRINHPNHVVVTAD